jgi:hypothetical protein
MALQELPQLAAERDRAVIDLHIDDPDTADPRQRGAGLEADVLGDSKAATRAET